MSRRSRMVGGDAGERDSRQSHDCVAARCEEGLAGKAVVIASSRQVR